MFMSNRIAVVGSTVMGSTERIVDLALNAALMGATIYFSWQMMRKAGLIKSTVRKTVRGKVLRMTQAEADTLASCAVDPSNITVSFEDIGGHDEIVRTVDRLVVAPFRFPGMYPRGSVRAPPMGILLYGPPGTGKTMIAKAIAKRTGAFFMEVKLEHLFGKFVGESEANVAAVFSVARMCEPSILFLDEIDSMLSSRSESDHAVYANAKSIFLRMWDGFSSAGARIVVIGATNLPHSLDRAVIRRLPIRLHVPLPDTGARHDILRLVLRGENTERVDLAEVAAKTEGMCGGDLRELCTEACSIAILEAIQRHSEDIQLSTRHFADALVGCAKGNQWLDSTPGPARGGGGGSGGEMNPQQLMSMLFAMAQMMQQRPSAPS
jgi:ATPase family AAA domain-containing protein 1